MNEMAEREKWKKICKKLAGGIAACHGIDEERVVAIRSLLSHDEEMTKIVERVTFDNIRGKILDSPLWQFPDKVDALAQSIFLGIKEGR